MKTITSLIAFILLAIPQGFFAQDGAAPKPSGPVVELNLIVTDKDGKPITRIAKDEIRIFEDNVEQSVLNVEADDRPIDYGLIMDSSASLRFLIAAAVEAAKLIITNKRGADEIFIEAFVKAEKLLNTITEETGGRVFYPKTGPELINASAEIIDHLRAQFRLTYQSSKNLTKGLRKVEVKLISQSGERRNAIARRGYYFDSQAKPKEQKSQ